jgi:hypothetical protein
MLERLRSSAVIEWKDENLQTMYETRVAERTGATETTAGTAP